MREIRFKAWNKKSKCWLNPRQIFVTLAFEKITATMTTLDFDDLEIIQFTGLLDKNGKEIYEGDIIKFKFLRSSDPEEIGEVVFRDGCFEIKDYESCCLIAGIFKCEVIGNIFENPEILWSRK